MLACTPLTHICRTPQHSATGEMRSITLLFRRLRHNTAPLGLKCAWRQFELPSPSARADSALQSGPNGASVAGVYTGAASWFCLPLSQSLEARSSRSRNCLTCLVCLRKSLSFRRNSHTSSAAVSHGRTRKSLSASANGMANNASPSPTEVAANCPATSETLTPWPDAAAAVN